MYFVIAHYNYSFTMKSWIKNNNTFEKNILYIYVYTKHKI